MRRLRTHYVCLARKHTRRLLSLLTSAATEWRCALSACHTALLRGILSSVSLKAAIIALLFLGVGFVIGLPMGVLFEGADTGAERERPEGAESGASELSENAGSPGARFHSVSARLANAGRGEKWDALLADTKAWVQTLNLADTRSLALAWLSEPRSNESTSLLRLVFARWMKLEPSAAWSAAESAQEERRLDALMGCLDWLCGVDFLSAWHRAESVTDAGLRKDLLRDFGWQASQTWDAAKAVRALVRLAEKDRPEHMFDRAIESWGKKNLGEALAFAQTLPVADRESALAELCGQFSAIDRDEAVRLASTINDKEKATQAWRSSIGEWFIIDPDWALGVMETMPLEKVGSDIWDRIDPLFAMPPDALRRIADRLPASHRDDFCQKLFRDASVMSLAEIHRRMDAIGMTDDDGGEWAGDLTKQLLIVAPESTRKWASGLPPGRLRDSVMGEILPHLSRESPAQAAAMVASIADANTRTTAFQNVMERWLGNDRSAAVRWLREAPAGALTAEEKQRWLRFAGAIP